MSAEDGIFDVVLRYVPRYGWLYLLVIDGKEEARGEFKPCASAALACGMATSERLGFGGTA